MHTYIVKVSHIIRRICFCLKMQPNIIIHTYIIIKISIRLINYKCKFYLNNLNYL